MNLYDAVIDSGCVKRLGELTLVNLSYGYGGLVIDSTEFLLLRKWAQRRTASENSQRDIQQFIAHLDVAITRIGSALATQGSTVQISRLVNKMKSSGLTLTDWNIPKQILDELAQQPDEPAFVESRAPEASTEPRQPTQADFDRSISFAMEMQRALSLLGLDLSRPTTDR